MSGDQGDGGASRAELDFSALKGAVILVVDDEPDTLKAILRVLEQCEAKVITCSNAEQAKRVVYHSETPLDAAVVDYFLLDRLGIEVINALRQGRYPCCSLMMTGSSSPDAGLEAIRAGADDFLIKPFGLDAFLTAVLRVVIKTRAWQRRVQDTPNRPDRATAPPFLDSDEANTKALEKLLSAGGRAANGNLVLNDVVRWLSDKAQLSKREAELLPHLIMGLDNLRIAEALSIRDRTVKFHVQNLLKKLRARNRADIIRIYITGELGTEDHPGKGKGGKAPAVEPQPGEALEGEAPEGEAPKGEAPEADADS